MASIPLLATFCFLFWSRPASVRVSALLLSYKPDYLLKATWSSRAFSDLIANNQRRRNVTMVQIDVPTSSSTLTLQSWFSGLIFSLLSFDFPRSRCTCCVLHWTKLDDSLNRPSSPLWSKLLVREIKLSSTPSIASARWVRTSVVHSWKQDVSSMFISPSTSKSSSRTSSISELSSELLRMFGKMPLLLQRICSTWNNRPYHVLSELWRH